MERSIKQIITSLILEYLSKLIFIIIAGYIFINLYHQYGREILNINIKSPLEFLIGIFILGFVFLSYRFYLKVDNLIIKDMESIIDSINYNNFEDRMNTLEFTMIEKTLADKNKKIIEKDRFINSSLAYISHDMKTPITVINTNIRLLKDSKNLGKKNIERLIRIEDETDKISDYIENLMDVSGAFIEDIKREKISLAELLASIERNIEIYADLREEKIEFKKDFDREGDFYLLANPGKIQKSFIHLLNNAYEHRREKIKVSLSGNGKEVIIRVEDDGLGFNEEALMMAKDIFYTSNHGRSSGKGYGIGLYFVNSYMEALGGKLFLGNGEDGGAIQSMVIPLFRGD